MALTRNEQLAAVSAYFATRREAILLAWRKADRADPEQATGRSLTLGQFLDHIPEMHELGAVAFKGFMSAAGADYPMVDDGTLLDGLQVASRVDAVIGVHAESEALTAYFTDQLARAGRQDPRAIAEGRPPIAEYEAMQRAIVLARHAKARLHIVHMSIPEGADLIQTARRNGVRDAHSRPRSSPIGRSVRGS